MSKILLAGPAGSGKTHCLLDDFEKTLREASDPLAEDFFFVVPSAEHTERILSLMVQRGIKGMFHPRITTLDRLIAKVFASPEEGIATNVARYLILHELFERESWGPFAGVQKTHGFLNLMLSFLLELKESLVTVSLFRERMNELKRTESGLAEKYEALAGMYEAYQSALTQKNLRDRQDDYFLYGQAGFAESKPLRKTRFRKIWVDGFFDFSELQAGYLRALLALTEDMTVTLTLDHAPARCDLFESPLKTETLLHRMGFESKNLGGLPSRRVSKHKAPVPLNRRTSSPTLSYLERHLFSLEKPGTLPAPGSDLEIFEAVGMEGEVEMIAREIETLHRRGGYRLSDFAVLLRQVGDYDGVIRSVFGRYGIPVEIHERERLWFSPSVQMIVKLLKIFTEGWKRGDLLDFLKSAYVRCLGGEKKDYEWVSRLEHYSLREGIFQGRPNWLAPPFLRRDEERGFSIEAAEKLAVLAQFEDALRGEKNFSGMRRIFMRALEKDFGIFEQVNSLEEYARRDAAGRRRFEALLDEIETSVRALRGQGGEGPEITLEQFAERFFRLAELDLYSLHEREKNRVQVYSVSLARQKEYRVVFVAGLLEKKFPVPIREDPVLNDWERRLFNGMRTEGLLAERLSRQMTERYLFYLAVTRAREKIFLTYPRLDLEGKESLPSLYVQEVRLLFSRPPLCRRQNLSRPYPEIDKAVSDRELEMGVMGALWTPQRDAVNREPLLLYLVNQLLERPGSRERFRRAFYEIRDELTDPEIIKQDVFRSLETSPSRLETYAKCPFRYYGHYVLKLQDPEEDLNVMLRGTILHEVLEKCFRAWFPGATILNDIPSAKGQAFLQLEKSCMDHPLLIEKKYQYDLDLENFREMLDRFLEHELERLRSSRLKPCYFEYVFGSRETGEPALEIQDGQRRIRIGGRIDRIDVDASKEAGDVIDYKRTATFKRSDLELGVALQLPIYAMVLETFLKLRVAGAELYSIRECEKKGFYHATYLELFGALSRQRMVLKEEELRALLARAADFIRKFSRDMAAAKIPVKPRSCEPYCPYASVCRIEKWRLPMILEEIKKEDANEID